MSQSVLDWDNYHGSFKQNVNYLTGVLDKQAKQQEMKDRKKALMDKHT